MNIANTAMTLLTVFMLSFGQVLFKIASERFNFSEKNGFISFLFNPYLITALIVYMLATFLWIFVLRDVPLRTAYPFASLAFIMVPLFAYYFLGEALTINNFIGGFVIIIGVYISTR
jgi:undecaprenyl phosphate-alpha-L-ara4N flippase subunit ArnE